MLKSNTDSLLFAMTLTHKVVHFCTLMPNPHIIDNDDLRRCYVVNFVSVYFLAQCSPLYCVLINPQTCNE